MSSKIFTPINQVKLTNVAVVRLKKGGKRFEVACYKNKMQDYRNKLTTDLDEVLQIHCVFLNVSKGQTAKESEILAAFGTTNIDQVILEILGKGELQVGSEERGQQLQMMTREVATIIGEKCVNPVTGLPHPISIIEQALTTHLHFSPNLTKSAKQQALECIRLLEQTAMKNKFPIARAQMRLMIRVPVEVEETFEQQVISSMVSSVEGRERSGDEVRIAALVEPGKYRQIIELVQVISRGRGSVGVLSLNESRKQ